MLRRPARAAATLRRPAAAGEAPMPEHGDVNALSEPARSAALSAIADEAWSELTALDTLAANLCWSQDAVEGFYNRARN